MDELIIGDSEQSELEDTLNGIGMESYTWLLAYYFLQGDVCKAEALWKRVPEHVKQRSPEFEAVWKVGTQLWEKNTAGFYQAVGAYQWTVLTSPIIAKLTESVRQQAISRIGASYSSISIQDMAALLGLSIPEVESEVLRKTGWMLQDDGMVKISGGNEIGPSSYQFSAEGRDDIKKIIDLLYFAIALIIILIVYVIFL